jgi:hypothetical protein
MEENKFTVKDVSGAEKSKVEIEEKLLKEHEEKFEATESNSNVERVDTSSTSAETVPEQKEVQPEGKAQEETPASEILKKDMIKTLIR